MFSRIKASIDRTIAEEQARQRASLDQPQTGHARQSGSVSRSNSGANASGRAPRPKKSAQDASKDAELGAANPDPAVFEAAFVIDDEEPSRSTTPLPPSEHKNSQDGGDGSQDDRPDGDKGDTGAGHGSRDPEKDGGGDEKRADEDKPVPPPKPAAAELPPEVRARLRKLEKLEATYPG